MRYYTTSTLSEHISTTPEGYLLCTDVPIARLGVQEYLPSELPMVDAAGKDSVLVYRLEPDVFAAEAIASFAGKPVTLEHPDDQVGPATWRELSRGVVLDPRRGTGDAADLMLADLLITDAEAIDEVRDRNLRQVSCGYDAEYETLAPGVGRQTEIVGNHVALVAQGRCGPRCAIQDQSIEETHRMAKTKSGWLDRLLGNPKVRKAMDEAAEELAAKDEGAETTPPPEQQTATDNDAKLDEILLLLRGIAEAVRPAATDEDPDKPEETGDEDPDKEEPTGDEDPDETAKTGDRKPKKRTADADTVRRARIIAPHLAARVGDSRCVVQRAALRTALKDEALATGIKAALRGSTLDSADCLTLDAAFVVASEMARTATNDRTAKSLTRTKTGDFGKAMTPAEINEINRKYHEDRK